ncbi:MAG: class I SAM-dependent methyltransferase [Leptolyngbyaceae cyanobacterium]
MEGLVQQQYDRWAAIYDQRWRFYIHNTLSFLLDWVPVNTGDHVLDVACGTGELERRLVTRHPDLAISGVDFSSEMLAIAQQKCADLPTVSFQVASATALPWQSGEFDWVICANAFHYFDAPQLALAEMQRMLKPSGRVVILDWCRDFWVCRLCDWVLGWLDPAHKNCYTEAELHDLLALAEYRIERSQRLRFGLIWGLMAVEAVPLVRVPTDH